MNILVFQLLTLFIATGYIGISKIKINETEKLIKEIAKQDYQDIKEYYEICNETLQEILNDFNKENYPELPPIDLQLDNQDCIERLNSLIFYPELEPIINKLINYIEPKHLIQLILNLQTLQIVYPDNIPSTPSYNPAGEYNYTENKIYIYGYSTDTLSHELLHAASTTVTPNYTYIGFAADNGAENFFCGFNEGYTEVLNRRIFGSKKLVYPLNYIACILLEIMFEDPKELEIAYFNNRVDVFIKQFLTYGTKEELVDILKALDCASRIPYTYKEGEELINMICSIIGSKNNPDKILKCEQAKSDFKIKKQNRFIKRLVKKI